MYPLLSQGIIPETLLSPRGHVLYNGSLIVLYPEKTYMNRKSLLLSLAFLLASVLTVFAQVNPNSVYVQGHYRSDGTYVQGHYKTVSNNTNRDNYTTKPNVNPYTGVKGTIEPDNRGVSYNTGTLKSVGSSTNYNISAPVYRSAPSTTTYTGPKGGSYYINSNGNKTYIKK